MILAAAPPPPALVPVGAAMALGYKVIVLVAGRLNNTRNQ